jgi:tetratricopeptide (TPR) repeat protein
MSNTGNSRGSLSAALTNLMKLLAANPALAEAQAREILRVVPDQPDTLSLFAAALAAQGKLTEAVAALARLTANEPQHLSAWRDLGDLHTAMGKAEAANTAYLRHVDASVGDRAMMEAGSALAENRLAEAETILRAILKDHPTDIGAIRMLAEIAARLERYEQAEKLLRRALQLAPGFDAARTNLATVLHRQNRSLEAKTEIEILLARDPAHPGYRNQYAAVLARLGETDAAIKVYEGVVKDVPNQPKIWMSYGHTLKTAGRRAEAETAYRQSVTVQPSLGEAWWSLANLKTFRFSDDDIAVMQREAAREGLADEDRLHLDFALGKAFEDREDYAASFAHYDAANLRRRQRLDYNADETTAHKNHLKASLTAPFFAAHAGHGCPAPDPIFVVGLPRSGSTLVEQILASHSAVEGTMELPDIFALAGALREKAGQSLYPDVLGALTADELRALGEEYLARTRIHRKLGRPFFIDKMPNNFLQIGFIALILPNAKIVDVRRHPMACGFSCFKQHFARGQGFSYSLTDIGRYYADYADLMAHFDAVLPGRIVRVVYEELVADLEANVRRLLAACGLPYEEDCLKFYQNDRIVRTASSEQVRLPIFSDAVEHWRAYDKWLDPLKNALRPTP